MSLPLSEYLGIFLYAHILRQLTRFQRYDTCFLVEPPKKIVCFIKFTRKKNNHYWRMGGIRLLVVEPWKNKFNVFLSLVCVNSRGWWNIIRLTNFQPRHKKIYNSFLCLLGPEILNRILKYVIRVFPFIIYLISLHPGVLTQ